VTAAVLRPLLVILLLGPFLLAPAAQAATSEATIRTVLRDCEDDGMLSGSYRASELRDSLRQIGTDLDQYSDCRDVINSAVQRALGGSGGSNGGAGGDPTSGGADGGGGAGGAAATGGGSPSSTGGGSTGEIPAPPNPEEQEELDRLRAEPSVRAIVGGAPLELGQSNRLAAAITHPVPTPLLVALVLLVAGGLLAALPKLRRRLLDRRASA